MFFVFFWWLKGVFYIPPYSSSDFAPIFSLLRDPPWSSSDFAPIFNLLRGCSDLELCLTNNPAFKFFVSKCPYLDRGRFTKPSVSSEYPNFWRPYQTMGGRVFELWTISNHFWTEFYGPKIFSHQHFFSGQNFLFRPKFTFNTNFFDFWLSLGGKRSNFFGPNIF